MTALWLACNVGAFAEARKIGQDMEKTAPDPTADYIAIYEEARKQYTAEKFDDAFAQVEVVLAKYPHYQPAVKLRALIDARRRDNPAAELRKRMDRIVIPRVNFKDALVEATLDFLRDESRRLDRTGKGVNLVVLLPESVRKRKITLDLIDARASDVLDYIAEGAGFKYRIERSAVVITANEPSTPESPKAVASAPPEPELPTIPGAP
jgi:hypothetical protein